MVRSGRCIQIVLSHFGLRHDGGLTNVTRGIWNPLSEGDGETLRRFIHTLRYFNEYVVGGTFEPLLAVATDTEGVYCSRFGGILYTCINRLATPLTDIQLHLPPAPQGHTYWDVWYGAPLQVF